MAIRGVEGFPLKERIYVAIRLGILFLRLWWGAE